MCSEVTTDTLPCSGTYACLCKHTDKEYYRLSKTMPVIPIDYPGLNTTLWEVYNEEESIEEEEKEDKVGFYAMIIGSSVGGTLLLCCICYCAVMWWAQRRHRVTYEDNNKKEQSGGYAMSKINKKPVKKFDL